MYNTIKKYSPKYQKIKDIEPSVGVGAFIPQFLRLVDDCDLVEFDIVDVSQECIEMLRRYLQHYDNKNNVKIY